VDFNRKPALTILVRVTSCLAFVALAVAPHSARAELLTGYTTINLLERFDSTTPGTIATSVAVTGLQTGETLLGIDRRPDSG
jgi:hypothetical protein